MITTAKGVIAFVAIFAASVTAFVPRAPLAIKPANSLIASPFKSIRSLAATTPLNPIQRPSNNVVVFSGGSEEQEAPVGTFGLVATALGLIANPVVLWSEYTLKTTGCGLPAGPGGALGALEGISYLVVTGIFGWSLYTKFKTGKGLPAGPAGLLGAVEGLSFLAITAGIIIAGLTFADYGSIPEAVPVDGGRCSNI